jgi:phenylacetate-CoA ligase
MTQSAAQEHTASRYFEPQIEAASRAEVERLQLELLGGFLRDFAARSPFHASRAAAAGVDLQSVRSLDEFRALPTMTKEDVIAAAVRRPPFGDLQVAADDEIAHYVETSGTSARGPERYVMTKRDLAALARQEAFGFCWAGVTPGRFVATTVPMTTTAAGRWHAMGVEAVGGVYLPLGACDAKRKLEYLRRFGAHSIIATPSYLRRIELEAQDAGIRPADLQLEALMVSAEPFSPEWALERQEMWGGATVYEQYGSSQRAFAWSCEAGAAPGGRRGALHLLSHLGLFEVVDPDTGRDVADGETGELIITPFASSTGQPLVRYATGDKVKYLGHDACPCGRPLAAIEAGSVYRYDDRLKVKGVNLEPDALNDLIVRDGVLDYEGEVAIDAGGRETLSVRVEVAQHGPEVDTGAIARRLKDATGLAFDVGVTEQPIAAAEVRGDVRKRRRWHDLRQH